MVVMFACCSLGGCLGFAQEAAQGLLIALGLGRKDLDGYRAVQVHVIGPVDDTHAPFAQFAHDLEVATGSPRSSAHTFPLFLVV